MKQSNKRNSNSYFDYVCPVCWYTLDKCTCECKPWNLVQIDRGIQKHIRILNRKGYRTLYCCESHSPLDSIYISFALGAVTDTLFQNYPVPDGFKVRSFHNGKTISHRFTNIKEYNDFLANKQKHLDSLLQWCKSLPRRI